MISLATTLALLGREGLPKSLYLCMEGGREGPGEGVHMLVKVFN